MLFSAKRLLSLRITRQNSGNRLTCTIKIDVRDYVALVVENRREHGVRVDVFQAIFRFQPELVVLQQWVGLNDDMRRRMPIVTIAGCDTFGGIRTATQPIVLF